MRQDRLPHFFWPFDSGLFSLVLAACGVLILYVFPHSSSPDSIGGAECCVEALDGRGGAVVPELWLSKKALANRLESLQTVIS